MANFPDELLQAQGEWMRTYEALAAVNPRSPTALRRRLLLLSTAIERHPFWRTEPGKIPAARVELKRQARRQQEVRQP